MNPLRKLTESQVEKLRTSKPKSVKMLMTDGNFTSVSADDLAYGDILYEIKTYNTEKMEFYLEIQNDIVFIYKVKK